MNPLRTISLVTALLIATAACGGSSGNHSPGSSTIAPPDTTVPGASTVDSTDPLPSTIDGDTVDSSAPSGLQARLLTQSDLGSGWIATYSQPGDEFGSFGDSSCDASQVDAAIVERVRPTVAVDFDRSSPSSVTIAPWS